MVSPPSRLSTALAVLLPLLVSLAVVVVVDGARPTLVCCPRPDGTNVVVEAIPENQCVVLFLYACI
jgi:hypothetical protein